MKKTFIFFTLLFFACQTAQNGTSPIQKDQSMPSATISFLDAFESLEAFLENQVKTAPQKWLELHERTLEFRQWVNLHPKQINSEKIQPLHDSTAKKSFSFGAELIQSYSLKKEIAQTGNTDFLLLGTIENLSNKIDVWKIFFSGMMTTSFFIYLNAQTGKTEAIVALPEG